jgi:raffinose/stachyose/melibiose transport system permease protein
MVKRRINQVIVITFLVIVGIVILFPIYIALINSFKTDGEMANSVLSLPRKLDFSNYSEAIKKLDFLKTFFNTLMITVVAIVGILFTSSMAGYKLARSKSKVSSFFYLLFISSMLIPFHSIMIPLTRVTMVLGIKGTKLGLSAVYIGLGINMAVFLYKGFISNIPIELEEAAKIDGCNQFQIYWHVILPLLKPITVTIAILDVVWIWNDFLLPLLMITEFKNYTIVLAAASFFGKYSVDWTNALAGLIFASLPLIIFYMFFQRYIVEGMTAGSMKG